MIRLKDFSLNKLLHGIDSNSYKYSELFIKSIISKLAK